VSGTAVTIYRATIVGTGTADNPKRIVVTEHEGIRTAKRITIESGSWLQKHEYLDPDKVNYSVEEALANIERVALAELRFGQYKVAQAEEDLALIEEYRAAEDLS
jgi:hypothetical protein